MSIRARRLVPLLFGPALLACSLVANLGDRTLADTTDGGGSERLDDGGGGTTDPVPIAVEAAPAPSYCGGITLYATFDTKLTGDIGGEATTNMGGVTLTGAGKFGGALSLVRSATAPEDGAALYFTATAKGNPWPRDVGSLSVWYRVAPGATPEIPVLYRPVGTVPPTELRHLGPHVLPAQRHRRRVRSAPGRRRRGRSK